MIAITDLPYLYNAFRLRWSDRDDRMFIMDEVVRGDFSEVDPNETELENRSPNLIQVALEDTAEAASYIPSVRCTPSSSTQTAEKRAGEMEKVGVSYLDQSQWGLRTIESNLHFGGFGFYAWTVTHDPVQGGPVIELRDPRTCFPEPGHRPGDSVRRCIFARQVYVSQLPKEHRLKVEREYESLGNKGSMSVADINAACTLVEFYDEDETLVAAMLSTGPKMFSPTTKPSPSWLAVELERIPHTICPVVVGQRPTLDGEPRGQFDQVVGVMRAHIRLMAMVLDYADQAVYSDVWVKDLIGELPWGGGSYIQLGATGAIGRVPPAVSSFAVAQELQQLVDNIHLGGRWPKSRPGEIDQAIASAKFIEATTGMMNTVIRTHHLVMKQSLEQALRIAFTLDKAHGKKRAVSGIRMNQQFLLEHDPETLDLSAQVRVDYGMGLGRDPAQSMVLGIQAHGAGIVSLDFVQENFEGITDVGRERERIDVQKLEDMAMAQLLEGLQTKTIPPTALAEIAKARRTGQGIIELFDKFVAQPQAEAASAMMSSGLPGQGPVQPGMSGGPSGPMPPPPPDIGGLLGGLAGKGGQPTLSSPPESIGRLSVPLGNGSFAGTTAKG